MATIRPFNRRSGRSWGLIVLTLMLFSWGSTAASAAAHPAKSKRLSLSNVIIHGPDTGASALLWIAQHQGFFKQQGVTVTLDDSNTTSAAAVAILLSGAAQFLDSASGTEIEAANAGAPMRAVFMVQLGNSQEVAINATTAAAKGIPANGSTHAQALAQLMALKGSHLTIAVSNTASDAYNWLYTLARIHGLSIGSSPSNDFNITTVGGSPLALEAAVTSGKVDGIDNVPPVTVIANTIEIPLYNIAPAGNAAGTYLTTSIDMIKQHPDTVQAVTNAFTEAMRYSRSHPNQSEKDTAIEFTRTAGITSPEENLYLYQDSQVFWTNPFPTKAGFANEATLINGAQAPALTLTYSTFVDPRFATVAIKKFPK